MTAPPPAPDSAQTRLATQPARFGFDAAVRLLLLAGNTPRIEAAMRIEASTAMTYPAAPVLAVIPDAEGKAPTLRVGLPGLVGADGVLPRPIAEQVALHHAHRLARLLGLVSQGLFAALAEAGRKYRLDLGRETARLGGESLSPAERALLAIAGLGGPAVARRLGGERETLLYYAGLFSHRPRSAARLATLAADWLGQPVSVIEFTGRWRHGDPDQRTRLPAAGQPGIFCRLGGDAALGGWAWVPQSRLTLRVGPLDGERFSTLLPDRPGLARLFTLLEAYLGLEVEIAVALVVAADAVPGLSLGAESRPAPRLGWNTWLGRRRAGGDRDEARFTAASVAHARRLVPFPASGLP